MINVQTLAVLLRALRNGEPSSRATMAPRPVANVRPLAPLWAEDGSSPTLRSATERLAQGAADAWGAPDEAATPHERGAALAGRPPEIRGDAPRITRPGTAAATTAPTAATPGTPVATGAAAATETIALSSGAALVSEALRFADDGESAPVIRAGHPLLDAPPQSAAALAGALHRSIARSGLFYEAHLAQWVMQGYPTAELAHEPQSRWPTLATATDGIEPATMDHAAPAPTAPAAGAGAVREAAVRELVAPLVRQQLDVLESGRLAWNGEVWPGQRALIAFAPDPYAEERNPDGQADDAGDADTPPTAALGTRLELTLPTLGRVIATVHVRGTRVTCHLRAASAAAAQRLEIASDAFAQALREQALALATCTVDHDAAS